MVLIGDCDDDRVGVFATLTNSYALVATGGSMNFYRFGPMLLENECASTKRLIRGFVQCFRG